MMSLLYVFFTWAVQPLVRYKCKRRARDEPLYGEHLEERFGRFNNIKNDASFTHDVARPLIWIHAVSLGETRAAAILLQSLRVTMPAMRLLLTHGTATGRTEGAKLLQSSDIQVWQPWDSRTATRAFITHFKPSIGILMETELWPNLIQSANDADVPVALVNARLSEKSFRKSQRFGIKQLTRQAYRGLAVVYAQTTDDSVRLASAGAKVDDVFGNLKFDITPSPEQLAQAQSVRSLLTKPVVVFASSRAGEEAAFLSALKKLSEDLRSSVQWLIVPRHPQRFDEVAALIEDAGFSLSRRHGWTTDSIWLGDSVGEMVFYYGISKAALLGGSFERLGGQNLIEALACGCPVVMGPHTFNFQQAADLASAEGVAFRVNDLAHGIERCLALVGKDGLDAANAARHFVTAHRGAAARTAAAIQSLIA